MRAEKQSDAGAASGNHTCANDDSGLKLPAGSPSTAGASELYPNQNPQLGSLGAGSWCNRPSDCST
jgi:hypothetical protein